MLLSQYLISTAQLLQDPQASSLLYSTSDLTSYVNQARTFLAGDMECCRTNGTLALAAGTQSYSFSSITFPAANTYTAPVYLRNVLLTALTGAVSTVFARPYPWFALYNLNTSSPLSTVPKEWAQQGQGDQGTVYFYPLPATAFTATIDIAAFPAPLVDDTTPDAIPNPFTLAVPYYAAYLAYLSAQRTQDAQGMYSLYRQYADQARTTVNGTVLAYQGAQPRDPAAAARFGQPKGGGQ